MDVQFGISCFFADWKEMEIVLDIFSRFPLLTHLELSGEYPFLFPGITSVKTLEYYKDVIKRGGIKSTIHSTIFDVNLATLNPIVMDANKTCIKTFIDYAEFLGSETVVVHSGVVSNDLFFGGEMDIREKVEESVCESLRELGDYAQEKGVVIGLENLPARRNDSVIWGPDEHIRILKKVNHPMVGGVLDFGHGFLSGVDLIAYLGEMKPFLVEIHAHNNHGEEDDHLGLHHGKIDYQNILDHPNVRGVPFIMELSSYSEVVSTLEWLS